MAVLLSVMVTKIISCSIALQMLLKQKLLLRLWKFDKITYPQSYLWLQNISAFIDRIKKMKHLWNVWVD